MIRINVEEKTTEPLEIELEEEACASLNETLLNDNGEIYG